MSPTLRFHAPVVVAGFVVAVACSSVARADEQQRARLPAPPEDDSPVALRVAPPPLAEPDADQGADADTVLGSHVEHGGYGSPELKLTSLSGRSALLVGGEGGWIIGRRLVLGGGGYGAATEVQSPSVLQPAGGDAHLSMGGGATSSTSDGSFHRSDSFFVVEPDLAAEVNLARHVRLAIGGSYRFVGGTEVTGFTATRLNGPAATLALRFGLV
jgi:hypothetical protein